MMEITAERQAHIDKIGERLPEFIVLHAELTEYLRQTDKVPKPHTLTVLKYIQRYEALKDELNELGFPIEVFVNLVTHQDYLSEHQVKAVNDGSGD